MFENNQETRGMQQMFEVPSRLQAEVQSRFAEFKDGTPSEHTLVSLMETIEQER